MEYTTPARHSVSGLDMHIDGLIFDRINYGVNYNVVKSKSEKFEARLRRHVCPQPDICVISNRATGILAAIER
ncbi:hypothetical protein GOBAR_AA22469 [Gossypium barbadense]|uniref:Uncharacterized protein n=1 Tax=Gossypium barbadense TaxID=3634 RepID=A0A2P5X4D1_GOSBA|nr:hypothetical protein GOBAR_AA22469 [Gossypium barbadense]